MDNMNDLSSSLSFASSYVSNGSSGNHVSASANSLSTEHLSLSRLSDNLERLLLDSQYDYSDADIVVEGVPVGVNRCILAARSQFFHEHFKKGNDDSKKEGKPQYMMSELVPYGGVGCEAFKVVLNYLYTGKLKPPPPEVSTVSTCVDDGCAHDSCGPAINYAVELLYAAATFQMKELVQVVQRRLTNFVEKALVEDVIPILVASFHCKQSQLFSHCIQRVERSDLDNVVLEKELPHEVFINIKSLRLEYQKMADSIMVEMEPVEDKRLKSIRNIHMALDTDDVELVTRLLDESGSSTLDDACALHYAVAYCDPKIVKEVLGLRLGNTNLRNARGHTVLHVAARRKDPAVLVPLLNSGASALEITSDGQTAVAICRRLTRPKDYYENTKQGEVSNKDRICIDLLEREMQRNSMAVNMSNTSYVMADDLHVRLDYFENRVAFARLLFPAEAKLAMEVADHPTTGYTGLPSKGSSGNLQEVDLNETPSVRSKRLQEKLQALMKTVEMGRRFFPHCSKVLDKFLDDEMDMADYFLEKGTPEEQKNKKMRFLELKDDVQKAFCRDVAAKQGSVLTASSSSSSSPKEGVNRKVMADDLHVRLAYFENRVAFARLLFPAEAKLAMGMADHPTSGYTGLASKGSSGNPSVQSKTLQEKLQALIKTVEMGRRFYPHCSAVLDKFLEDQMNMADDFLDKGTPEEQKNKKMSFLELKDDVQKAFWKDVAEKQGSVLKASSSSSSSPKEGI